MIAAIQSRSKNWYLIHLLVLEHVFPILGNALADPAVKDYRLTLKRVYITARNLTYWLQYGVCLKGWYYVVYYDNAHYHICETHDAWRHHPPSLALMARMHLKTPQQLYYYYYVS